MDTDSEILLSAAKTAFGTAVLRMTETMREDRIIDDPIAALFVGGAPPSLLESFARDRTPHDAYERYLAAMTSNIVLRTAFFDEVVVSHQSRGQRQIVIVAAGLDSRSLRLDLPPGARVFELDSRAVMDFKQSVIDRFAIPAKADRIAISTDLEGAWPSDLLDHGFDVNQPTLWLLEGFVPYLGPDDIRVALQRIADLSAPESILAFDDASSFMDVFQDQEVARLYTAFIHSGSEEVLLEELEKSDWTVLVHDAQDYASRFDRGFAGPFARLVVASKGNAAGLGPQQGRDRATEA